MDLITYHKDIARIETVDPRLRSPGSSGFVLVFFRRPEIAEISVVVAFQIVAAVVKTAADYSEVLLAVVARLFEVVVAVSSLESPTCDMSSIKSSYPSKTYLYEVVRKGPRIPTSISSF